MTADAPVQSPGTAPATRSQVSVYAIAFFGHGTARMSGVLVPLFAVSLGMPAFIIGLVLGARHIPSLFLSIPSGALMDRIGARQVLMFFALVGVALPLLYPSLPYASVIIVLQMVFGYITNLSWQGAQTLVGQLLEGSPRYASRAVIANHVGALFCPLIIGLVWDHLGVWSLFATLSIFQVCFLVATVSLPKTGVVRAQGEAPLKKLMRRELLPRLSDYTDSFRLLSIPAVFFTVTVSLLDHCTVGINQSFYVVYLESIGLSGTLIGVLASSSSFCAIFGSMSTNAVAKHFNHYWMLVVGLTITIVAMSITPLLGVFIFLLMAAVVRGYVAGLIYPLVIVIMSRSVRHDQQGKSVGLRTTGNRLVGALIPIVMGALADWIGLTASFLVIGGILVACMGLVALYVHRTPAFRE